MLYRSETSGLESKIFKPVPKAVIDYLMKNHQGHWYNTTKEINKKFGKGDDGRQYKETELKKEYDNERRRKKRKGKKKFAKKKDAFKLKVKNNFENKEEKSSTNESTQNHAKDYVSLIL
mmetsp:Transcript_12917/g.11437  ORF Transcript_12917/g.11437 Transcript_12917/m.11437 type:complete len:119 (+) Transcript_12917:320-676(+)